jgi:hypothetical protein
MLQPILPDFLGAHNAVAVLTVENALYSRLNAREFDTSNVHAHIRARRRIAELLEKQESSLVEPLQYCRILQYQAFPRNDRLH